MVECVCKKFQWHMKISDFKKDFDGLAPDSCYLKTVSAKLSEFVPC